MTCSRMLHAETVQVIDAGLTMVLAHLAFTSLLLDTPAAPCSSSSSSSSSSIIRPYAARFTLQNRGQLLAEAYCRVICRSDTGASADTAQCRPVGEMARPCRGADGC